MSRFERTLVSWLIWLGATCGGLHAQSAPDSGRTFHIILDTTATNWVRELGEIADSATVEHGRCILGKLAITQDTLWLVGLYNAPAIVENAWSVRTKACPPLVTLGTWHIHLPWSVNVMNPQIRAPIPPMAACFLSPTDRHVARLDAALGAIVQVVQVSRDVVCAWLYTGAGLIPVPWPTNDGLPTRQAGGPTVSVAEYRP